SRSTSRRRTTSASGRSRWCGWCASSPPSATIPRAATSSSSRSPPWSPLGFCYEQRGRFSGGAYHPLLKRVDGWIDGPLSEAVNERERRAERLLALDDAVKEAVKRLEEAGLKSPYLKNFVVARI